ncbi:HAD family hydrolase [Rhodococcus sp. G-MC3]|uniref:HAD family hydrolase n=1 Tax=Rhodococcus sp. G-MC3 TaxID=3046209 RepID=UPI0024BAA3E1|nr:HAD family hydrolase [Rhodococcus sp. G-MC3]MDJ0393623.1 HAD family hydrolase [Rhodococcus sp. G-MC3]
MKNALVSVDLDRTMIYSDLALGFDIGDSVMCVETYEGGPLSYMTHVAAGSLEELTKTAVVVPTTTRTIEQFQRIALPGAPWRYAITSNGGNILVDGEPDRSWREKFADIELAQIRAELHSRADGDWVLKRRTADDLFCYLVVEPAEVPDGFLTEWSQWCATQGWNVSQQGRKIYTMPDAVCKSRAVAEVLSRCINDGRLSTAAVTFAAGDGALDADMLIAANNAIRPAHGELEALNFQHPGLTVTQASGALAGEEILTWLHERVGRSMEPIGPSVRPTDQGVGPHRG